MPRIPVIYNNKVGAKNQVTRTRRVPPSIVRIINHLRRLDWTKRQYLDKLKFGGMYGVVRTIEAAMSPDELISGCNTPFEADPAVPIVLLPRVGMRQAVLSDYFRAAAA